MRVATAKQIAEIDRRATAEFGVPAATLMERAGRQTARVALSMLSQGGGRRVVVLCGKGNNGGDGLVAAAQLRKAGLTVEAVLAAPESEYSGEARHALDEARQAGVPIQTAGSGEDERFRTADLIIDALFGTGFRGPVKGPAADLIKAVNESSRLVLAVDIPSGLTADTGRADDVCIRASATVTMGLPKVGLVVFPGAEFAGAVYVADIGYPAALSKDTSVPTHLVTVDTVRALLPARRPDSHKGDYGRVLIVAGSVGFTGAVVLATWGALRTGAGLVTPAVPESVYPIVASHVVEGMPHPLPDKAGAVAPTALKALEPMIARSDVIAAGPGLSQSAGVRQVVEGLLREGKPLVLDADALNVLAGKADVLSQAAGPLVITPHPGELGRLVESTATKIQEDRLSAARSAAKRFRCTVLLKGARTIVAMPSGEAYIVPTGNPGMATGGMGDVLAGAIASLIGQGLDPTAAAYCGAYLHGLAADLIAAERGAAGMLASEVSHHLPLAIERVRRGEHKDPIIELPRQ